MQLIFYKLFTPYYLLTWNQMGSSSHPNTRPMLWILYLSPNQPGRASLRDPFHPASTTDDYCSQLNFTHHLADSWDFEGLSLRVHWVQHVQTSSCLPHFGLLSSFHRFLKRRIMSNQSSIGKTMEAKRSPTQLAVPHPDRPTKQKPGARIPEPRQWVNQPW